MDEFEKWDEATDYSHFVSPYTVAKAAWKAGREAGMREASEKLRDQEWIDRVLEASPDEMTCEEAYSFAILSAIGGGK